MAKFGSKQLGDAVAVGAVTATDARIWFRAQEPGQFSVSVWPRGKPALTFTKQATIAPANRTDNTKNVEIRGLHPLNRYLYEVRRESSGDLIGRGSFDSAPSESTGTPRRFSFALMSCHQPFNTDGRLSERSMRMLKLVPKVLRDYDAKFVIQAGDQIYSDVPENFSLINPHYYATKVNPARRDITQASAYEVRQAFQERYRIFWQIPQWQEVLAGYPCYPILDDHEIMDDWGTDPKTTENYHNLLKGAREAYFDYQGSRILPRQLALSPELHYSFSYGNVSFFIMDIRSRRRMIVDDEDDVCGSVLYSESQFKALEAFLIANRHQRAIFIVVSVPIVHLPSWLADLGGALFGSRVDFADHWSLELNVPHRNRIMELLYKQHQLNPEQRLAFLSGDVHIGCAFEIRWEGGHHGRIYQFTSSAVSNRMKKIETYFSLLGPQEKTKMCCGDGLDAEAHLLEAREGISDGNPFGGLNIGIVEVEDVGDYSTIQFKLIGYPYDDKTSHETMFGSDEL